LTQQAKSKGKIYLRSRRHVEPDIPSRKLIFGNIPHDKQSAVNGPLELPAAAIIGEVGKAAIIRRRFTAGYETPRKIKRTNGLLKIIFYENKA
jgi:hypothetical protein